MTNDQPENQPTEQARDDASHTSRCDSQYAFPKSVLPPDEQEAPNPNDNSQSLASP